MKITASARVITGTKTNRVKVKRAMKSPGAARKAYRADPLVRGMDLAMVCASMPVAELEQLDAWCARVQMARSHFIRQAVKHFAEKIGMNPEQGKRWKEALR